MAAAVELAPVTVTLEAHDDPRQAGASNKAK
jgi:hypothetical protein